VPRPVELILARQWCALLTTPVLLFEPDGTLVYFNEAAAALLGRTYGESGGMTRPEWQAAFRMEDSMGEPLSHGDNPLARALDEGEPAQAQIALRGMDGQLRTLQVTSVPLGSLSQTKLGVMALLHEVR
jgi:PAS domain-containing protein